MLYSRLAKMVNLTYYRMASWGVSKLFSVRNGLTYGNVYVTNYFDE